jgi:aminoglycoside phosphotransferase (APT) family kinase protein
VWRVRLDDGREVVLKIGPPEGTALLSYERNLHLAEAEYFRSASAAGVPVPEVLFVGDRWMFMSLLDGTALPELPEGVDDSGARFDAGAAIARVHRLTGEHFGYTGGRASGATWRAAFTAMIDELLEDAVTWGVTLPVPAEELRAAVQDPALDAVTRPALLHWDLWDGNVLATVAEDGSTRMTGLVDGERYLCGDPLLDLVSPHLLRRIEDEPEHPFLRGYRSEHGPVELDRRRLALYRLHLYLVMLVEMPSRGMDPAGRDYLPPLIRGELDYLRTIRPVAS